MPERGQAHTPLWTLEGQDMVHALLSPLVSTLLVQKQIMHVLSLSRRLHWPRCAHTLSRNILNQLPSVHSRHAFWHK